MRPSGTKTLWRGSAEADLVRNPNIIWMTSCGVAAATGRVCSYAFEFLLSAETIRAGVFCCCFSVCDFPALWHYSIILLIIPLSMFPDLKLTFPSISNFLIYVHICSSQIVFTFSSCRSHTLVFSMLSYPITPSK